jgi:hypothetical protein
MRLNVMQYSKSLPIYRLQRCLIKRGQCSRCGSWLKNVLWKLELTFLGLYMPNQVKAPFQLFVKESSIWFYTAQHKSVNLLGILLQISFVFILQCIYIEVCYFLIIVFKSLNKIEYCSLWLHHTSSVVTHNFISFSWFWMLFKVKRQININNL